MEEDEECLPENSSLKLYLQDLGFSDFQVKESALHNPSIFKFEFSKPKSKWSCEETIDEEVFHQINILISTRMLFEEDVSNIEKLLSNFKVVKNGMLKSMFKDLFGVTVLFLGLCLYWVIGYYAFFIVSSFYAFSAANYLSKRHFNRARLQKLTSILQNNFTLLKKTFRFIEENKLIEANMCKNDSKEFVEGFDFYRNFKSDFLAAVNEIISILSASTQKLIDTMPLYNYIENPQSYICNNYNKNYEIVNLPKLYEIYLLIQSEFLQRLILSLIPNIKLSTKDSFQELNKLLTETCLNLLKVKNRLNKKFKFLFLNGIHHPKTKVEFKLPLNSKPSDNYCKEFHLNIHETSKTFQDLLLQCRKIEENITTVKIPENVEQELVRMQADLNACQRNITDCLTLLKRRYFIAEHSNKDDSVKVQEQKDINNSVEKLNKIMVGFTDLDPEIEDEVFEAYFANDKSNTKLLDTDEWNLDDKLRKEHYKSFMKELKLKLVDKAEYWKKREKEVLQKKGLFNVDEDVLDGKSAVEASVEKDTEKLDQQVSSECKEPLESFKCNFTDDFKKLVNSNETGDNQNFDNFPVDSSQASSECQLNYIETKDLLSGDSELENTQGVSCCGGEFNRSLLNDLNKAREKMFKACVQEELFYTSGEDSSSEENAPIE